MSTALDPEAEQSVDFGRYARALAARWWLPLLALAAGAVIGLLVATSSQTTSYTGRVQVYIGTPLASGNLVSTPPIELALVDSYITSSPVVHEIAAKLGVKPGLLKLGTNPVLGITGSKTPSVTPIVEVVVSGVPRAKALLGADLAGKAVVAKFGSRVQGVIATINEVLRFDTEQLAAIDARLAAARATQSQVLASKTISPTDKLVSLANLNSVITQALAQQIGLSQDRFQTRLNLNTIQTVSAPGVVVPAHTERAKGQSRKTAIVVGAFLGLVLGLLAALLWEPLVAGRARAKPQQA